MKKPRHSNKLWKVSGSDVEAGRRIADALRPLSRPSRQRVCGALTMVLQAELLWPGITAIFTHAGLGQAPLDGPAMSGTHEIREDPDFDR